MKYISKNISTQNKTSRMQIQTTEINIQSVNFEFVYLIVLQSYCLVA